VFAVGLVVVGVANEVARANRTTRIRGVGEIVIGVVALFVCLQASAKGPA
jgi:hypothetical protein